MPQQLLLRAFAAVIILTGLSCKKETEYAPSASTRLTSFSFAQSTGTISGAITTDSIVVYWPSYIAVPAKVSPNIVLAANATISPASGTEVNFATGTKFTVKAQNGSMHDYFLKVIINQPPIQVFENTYANVKGGKITVGNGTYMRYFARDTNITKFYILDTAGVAYQLPLEFFQNGTQEPGMHITIPDLPILKIGAYKIRITSGQQTYNSANFIFAILYSTAERPKAADLSAPVTVKQGGTITFTGTGFVGMKEARVYGYNPNFTEKEIGTFTLESSTPTSVTYKVPASFPAGVYEYGGYEANGLHIGLRTADFYQGWGWNKVNKLYAYVGGSTSFTVTAN